MRRVPRPAHRRRGWHRGHGACARTAGLGCALALGAALVAPVLSPAWTQEVGRTASGEHGAMTNWASDVATDVVSSRDGGPLAASRVSLDVAGGAVVVQWSLSYDLHVSVRGSPGDRPIARVEAMAGLERNDVEIARWTLGEDRRQGAKDSRAQARLTGTASGLFIDRAPGFGRNTYVLKVWNERAKRHGTVTLRTRAMICEKR
jgi:hypothetical protein